MANELERKLDDKSALDLVDESMILEKIIPWNDISSEEEILKHTQADLGFSLTKGELVRV
jgi:hypothetical protein